jgi:hypothetical protein
MHHCAIDDPSNVVILNVNGLELQEVNINFKNIERINLINIG